MWKTFILGKKLMGFEPLGHKWYLIHPRGYIFTIERKSTSYHVKKLIPLGQENNEHHLIGTCKSIRVAKAMAEKAYGEY